MVAKTRDAVPFLAAATLSVLLIIGFARPATAVTGSLPTDLGPVSGQVESSSCENICETLRAALESFSEVVEFSGSNVTLEQAQDAIDCIYREPSFFYLESAEMTCSNGYVQTICLSYVAARSKLPRLVQSYEEGLCKAISSLHIPENASDADRALAVHDYLIESCTYRSVEATTEPLAYTAYGAIVDRECVCDGYSFACIALLQLLGVNCEYVPSTEMCHSWVLVEIDGNWYHMDCTWDDNATERYGGGIVRDAFLRSDSSMKEMGYTGWSASHEAPFDWTDYATPNTSRAQSTNPRSRPSLLER